MDITETLTPKSDQLNAEDLLAGPRTVTVEKVTKGSVEQPVDIHLTEFPGRPFKPSKTVRRILAMAWGPEATNYTGRRMVLYRDPAVRFGGMDVGGIRISAMSHIDARLTVALTVTRGKRAAFTVEPLMEAAAPATSSGPSLGDLFDKAGLPKDRANDRLTVTRKVVGRPEIASAADLTPDELAALTSQLMEWDRAGDLTNQVGDILDQAAIDSAIEAEAK